jgi:hypothetical protein
LVNQVTFFFQDCGSPQQNNPLGHWYFAAYDPAHAGGAFILDPHDAPATMIDCATHAYIRTVSPAVKVVATKNYVAGVDSAYSVTFDQPELAPRFIILGAKVRYTCPNGC